jgi:hypothetical protein
MVGREFMMAGGGRVIFTLAIPASFRRENKECKEHYTYRVIFREATDKWPENWFVNLLAGPDNLSDYQYLGMLNPETGELRLTNKSRMSENSWPVRLVRRVFAALWAGDDDKIEAAGFELMHSGRCGHCGRVLTRPDSIEIGIGPTCRGK